jgi:hypothetical protein
MRIACFVIEHFNTPTRGLAGRRFESTGALRKQAMSFELRTGVRQGS